jgi:hypothetical protein
LKRCSGENPTGRTEAGAKNTSKEPTRLKEHRKLSRAQKTYTIPSEQKKSGTYGFFVISAYPRAAVVP